MTLTELRDTLSSVSDAVPVPVPDAAAFQRRVTQARRRRAAVHLAGAAAAVAVLAGGSSFALSSFDKTDHAPVTSPSASETAVPVVVQGAVRVVDGGVLGPAGPSVATLVGTTPHGVVALTDAGTLVRIDEQTLALQPLLTDKVEHAFLDGDAVVYQNADGLIRWRDIEPVEASTDSAQTEQGRLFAAGSEAVVIAASSAGSLVSHDADGIHPMSLRPSVTTVSGVDIGGRIVAVRTNEGTQFIDVGGTNLADLVGGRLGRLSPDGLAYAQVASNRVQLVDPHTAVFTPVDGLPTGVEDLGWAQDGDLLVVVQADGARTLWRCSPTGTGCAAQVEDPTGTLRLR
jgi:hypothetical protein